MRFLESAGKYISAAAINGNGKRKIAKQQFFDRFAPKIIISDHITLLDTLCGKSACSADGAKIHRFILDYGIAYRGISLAFADHGGKAVIQQKRCKNIHSAGSGWATGADCKALRRRSGAGVIDHGVFEFKRKFAAAFNGGGNSFMRGIPGSVNSA